MLTDSAWRLDSGSADSAQNMALDEALLEAMPRLGKPVLRFYGWTERAASFGYFQKYSEIERSHSIAATGPPADGGRLVAHDADWTYSLLLPTCHEWYASRPRRVTCEFTRGLRSAFARLNVPTELASCCRKSRPGQCFLVTRSLTCSGTRQKIAGAAQRRTRSGLLIQGSVQPPALSLDRHQWQEGMCNVGGQNGDQCSPSIPTLHFSRGRESLWEKGIRRPATIGKDSAPGDESWPSLNSKNSRGAAFPGVLNGVRPSSGAESPKRKPLPKNLTMRPLGNLLHPRTGVLRQTHALFFKAAGASAYFAFRWSRAGGWLDHRARRPAQKNHFLDAKHNLILRLNYDSKCVLDQVSALGRQVIREDTGVCSAIKVGDQWFTTRTGIPTPQWR